MRETAAQQHHAAIDALLARHGLTRLGEPSVVAGGTVNENFRVETPAGARFVRLHAAGTDADAIALEHRAIGWAGSRGIPVNPPCRAADGESAYLIAGRYWALFPWLEPRHIALASLDGRGATLLGATLGLLQATLAEFADPVLDRRGGDMRWSTARTLAELSAIENAVRADGSLGAEQAPMLAALALRRQLLQEQARPDHEFAGMALQSLHGDYHERNVIVDAQGEVRAVVDWEPLRRQPRVYELLRSLLFMDLLDSPLFDAYLAGYRRHVRLSAEECERGVAFWWQQRLHTTWAFRTRFLDGDRRTQRFLTGEAAQLRRWSDPAARASLAQRLRRVT